MEKYLVLDSGNQKPIPLGQASQKTMREASGADQWREWSRRTGGNPFNI